MFSIKQKTKETKVFKTKCLESISYGEMKQQQNTRVAETITNLVIIFLKYP